MRKRNKLVVPCLMALGMIGADKARAGVSFSYVTDQSTYSLAAGSTATVNIYLQETLTNASDVISTDGGLTGAGAGVNLNTSTGTAASFGSGAFTLTLASGFTGGNSAIDYNQGAGNNLEFVESIPTVGGTPIQPTVVNASTDQILLGTLNVKVGTGNTSYVLTSLNNDTINGSNSDLGQEDGNTTTKNPTPAGTDLDAINTTGITGADFAPTSTFTINATSANKIISFTAASGGAPTTYGSDVATLTVHSFGVSGQYTPALATLTPATQTGYVEGLTFSPASDKEVYALELTGLSSDPTTLANQLAIIESDINGSSDLNAAVASGVTGVYATEFPGYNLLLTFDSLTVSPPSGDNFLGFDFSAETNVPGVSVAAIALVPEPTSLGILAIGALGLLGRRRKRNAQ